MKSRRLEPLQIVIIALLCVFTILSAFPCIERWSYAIMIPVWEPGEFNGHITKMDNCFVFMLILGVLEILLLLKSGFVRQKINVVISVIRTLVTLLLPYTVFNGSLLDTIMTDISISYKMTPIGYVVLLLSWLILILEIKHFRIMRKCQLEVDVQGFN